MWIPFFFCLAVSYFEGLSFHHSFGLLCLSFLPFFQPVQSVCLSNLQLAVSPPFIHIHIPSAGLPFPSLINPLPALWPHNLPIPLVFEMGSLILLKLQSKAALDLSNQVINLLYLEHITYSDSKLAGYYFLHALLAHAADSSTSTLVLRFC